VKGIYWALRNAENARNDNCETPLYCPAASKSQVRRMISRWISSLAEIRIRAGGHRDTVLRHAA